MENELTKPKPRFPSGVSPNPADLAAGRYGTLEMVEIWGPEKTFETSLYVQGKSAIILSELHPDIVPREDAEELMSKANLDYVNPDRIREIEEKTGHDVIAINTALEEQVSHAAGTHINKFKTSADTTQPTRALQLQASLEIIMDSVQNLRDIVLEKSMSWVDIPFMETSHLYDALPSVAGRAFAHYGEMLQSGLNVLNFFYENSIIGKWADATGNHHSATALGIDGMLLQKEFCDEIGVGYMTAPAQIPGLEFEADIFYGLSRLSETMNNLAKYVANGRSDDVNVFVNTSPSRKKGSSAMPHKDSKNGNPTAEEQVMSARNYMAGNLVTAVMNSELPYTRNLAGSANGRINLEDGFKFMDHSIRRLANVIYWLGIRVERSVERVERSYGAPTSQQVMTYLTDHNRVKNPMTRSEAHDLMGELATKAWETKTPLYEVARLHPEVNSRIDDETLKSITDSKQYIGQSKEIVRKVFDLYHKAESGFRNGKDDFRGN